MTIGAIGSSHPIGQL